MSMTVTMEDTNQNRQANITTVQIDWHKAYLPAIALSQPSQPKACLQRCTWRQNVSSLTRRNSKYALHNFFPPSFFFFCAHVCSFDINCFYQCVVGHSKCTCNPSLSTEPSQHLSAPLTQDSSRIYGFPQTGNRFFEERGLSYRQVFDDSIMHQIHAGLITACG